MRRSGKALSTVPGPQEVGTSRIWFLPHHCHCHHTPSPSSPPGPHSSWGRVSRIRRPHGFPHRFLFLVLLFVLSAYLGLERVKRGCDLCPLIFGSCWQKHRLMGPWSGRHLGTPAPPSQRPVGREGQRALQWLSGQGCPQVWFSWPRG